MRPCTHRAKVYTDNSRAMAMPATACLCNSPLIHSTSTKRTIVRMVWLYPKDMRMHAGGACMTDMLRLFRCRALVHGRCCWRCSFRVR